MYRYYFADYVGLIINATKLWGDRDLKDFKYGIDNICIDYGKVSNGNQQAIYILKLNSIPRNAQELIEMFHEKNVAGVGDIETSIAVLSPILSSEYYATIFWYNKHLYRNLDGPELHSPDGIMYAPARYAGIRKHSFSHNKCDFFDFDTNSIVKVGD